MAFKDIASGCELFPAICFNNGVVKIETKMDEITRTALNNSREALKEQIFSVKLKAVAFHLIFMLQ